jgi:glycosyltransferase involved in cell wall biosynthesis
MTAKPSIAIIVPGGFGTGKNNAGIPALEAIVERLSHRYTVVVFQLFRMNPDYHPRGFEVVEVTNSSPLLRLFKFLMLFKSYHRRFQFIAVHGYWALPGGLFAVLAGKLWRIKSIVTLVGGDAIALPAIRYGQLNNFLSKKMVFFTLAHASKVIALTQYLVENLKKAGFQRSAIEIIPWCVDAEVFTYREKSPNRPVHFLHVANLHPVKDQATLLRAFALISRQVTSDLTIVGEGAAKFEVLSLINELHLSDNVFIKDPVPNRHLPEIYHQADILLHTSLSEGQGVVVAEAMATGVLVCGTRVGLIRDLEYCCVAVDVGDYEGLAKKTLRLLDDESRMTLFRTQARDWTRDHTIDWTVQSLGEIYSASR